MVSLGAPLLIVHMRRVLFHGVAGDKRWFWLRAEFALVRNPIASVGKQAPK